ncbi:MAG: YunC family protein [Candidatus Bathyarchaeia archaeon]
MFEIRRVKVDGDAFLGLKAELPGSPPLLLVVGNKGFIMCGYLNLESAEKLGAAAAVVSGVRSVEDVLKAEVKAATSRARELGIEPGAVVKDILGKLV